jgi:hypothetical protein
MAKKRKKLQGIVEKVIKPAFPGESEKAQIVVHEADDLYKEIRVENALTDDHGHKERLRPGEEVAVTLEADTDSKDRQPSPA